MFPLPKRGRGGFLPRSRKRGGFVMVAGYGEMLRWSRDYDLLCNRVGVVNEVLGCRYHHGVDSLLRVAYSHGRYCVTFDGSEVARFGVWDCSGLSSALATVDAWADCVWRVRRVGLLSPVACA